MSDWRERFAPLIEWGEGKGFDIDHEFGSDCLILITGPTGVWVNDPEAGVGLMGDGYTGWGASELDLDDGDVIRILPENDSMTGVDSWENVRDWIESEVLK